MLFMAWILRVYFPTLVVLCNSKLELKSQNMPAQNSALVPELPGAVTGTECENYTNMEVPMHVATSVPKLPCLQSVKM